MQTNDVQYLPGMARSKGHRVLVYLISVYEDVPSTDAPGGVICENITVTTYV